MTRVLLVFLDGVGLAPADPGYNPFAVAELPALRALLGAAPTSEVAPRRSADASLVGLDATLGVAGLPQSGTGQVALLTGVNAARLIGRHMGPWTPTALRQLLASRSILALARAAGLRVAFANAYPEELFAPGSAAASVVGTGRRRGRRDPLRAGPPLAALAAGVLTRHTPELEHGEALASEITNEGWRERLGRTSLPEVAPAEAGRNLSRIAAGHDLTFFAHYSTDTAGHSGDLGTATAALERVDAFLGGVVESLPPDTVLIVASDHGNIEDVRCGHTRNPALGLVHGPDHEYLATRLHAITDVAPAILETLCVAVHATGIPDAAVSQISRR